MQIAVSEFLNKVAKLKGRDKKVEALKYNDSFVLRTILQGAYDPRIEWLIPKGVPPFNFNTIPDQEHILINEARKLSYFVKGGADNLNQIKREALFIQLLEHVCPGDAELLLAIKEKKLTDNMKSINVEIVREAFPGLLPDV